MCFSHSSTVANCSEHSPQILISSIVSFGYTISTRLLVFWMVFVLQTCNVAGVGSNLADANVEKNYFALSYKLHKMY